MSNKSRRGPQIPPRPQIIPEQLRQSLNQQAGPRILNREQSLFIIAGLAANLERQLNENTQMPLVQVTTEKRETGVSIHMNLVEPTGDVDAQVI